MDCDRLAIPIVLFLFAAHLAISAVEATFGFNLTDWISATFADALMDLLRNWIMG